MKVSKNSKYQTHKKSFKTLTTKMTRKVLKGGTQSDFSTSIVAKHQKIEGGHFGGKMKKVSQCRKKLKGGTL